VAARLRQWWTQAARDEQAFRIVYVLLCIAALVPIWRVRMLPLLDEPNHLGAMYIWHHFGDPAARLSDFYKLNIGLVPYLAHYGLAHLAAFGLGIEAGNKLVLSIYVLALPLTALVWCRRTRRSPWLAVLAFPLNYSYAWAHGFHAFNLAVVACFGALCAIDAYLERPTWGRAIATLALSLACYLGHPLPFLFLGLCVPLLWIAHRLRPWRALALAALLAPSAYLCWRAVNSVAMNPMAKGHHRPLREGVHLPWREMLSRLPRYTLDSVSGDLDVAVFWILCGVTVLTAVFGLALRFRPTPEGPPLWRRLIARGRPLRDHRSALLIVAALVLYLFLPLNQTKPMEWWFVSGRFAPVMCFFFFLLPATSLAGWRALLVAPAALAALVLPLHISQKYVEFNHRAAPFVRLVGQTRPGSNVLFLAIGPRGDPAVNVDAYNQFGSWVQVLHGGFSPSAWNSGFPYQVTRRLPAPSWSFPSMFSPLYHGRAWDYVLVRHERRPLFPPGGEFRLAADQGGFRLYERQAPPAGHVPAPSPSPPAPPHLTTPPLGDDEP
jgi:hypothetical protein